MVYSSQICIIVFFTLSRNMTAESDSKQQVSRQLWPLIVTSNEDFLIRLVHDGKLTSNTSIRESLVSIQTIEELQTSKKILHSELLKEKIVCIYNRFRLKSPQSAFSFNHACNILLYSDFHSLFAMSSFKKLHMIYKWIGPKEEILRHEPKIKRMLVEIIRFSRINNIQIEVEIQSLLDMTQVIVNKRNNSQYELISKVGQGAYADVYKGINLATKELVAIKKMKSMKQADSTMAQKEIQLMKSLQHKNIVRWIDDFRSNGVWFIVLEYCGKGDLQKYKDRIAKIPQHHCKALVRGILQALVQIHSEKKIVVQENGVKKEVLRKKIAHRDLKLANILINDQYQLKLADFGFSKDFQDGWLKSFCGTPLTMAPQVLKREKYNEKCDVWSLGVIAYFLLYNKYPFVPNKIDGGGLPGLTKAATNRVPIFDESVQVSEEGKHFIRQCLQKVIDKRPFAKQLLNHHWWENSNGWTAIRRQYIRNGIQYKPADEARHKLGLLLFGVLVTHIQKIYEGLMISKESLENTIGLLQKYYVKSPKILYYYIKIIKNKLETLRKREIILAYEQQVSGDIEKYQFKISLPKIKCYAQFQNDVTKIIQPVTPSIKSSIEVNPAQQLVLFLIEQTQKLMDSFNQDEVDGKVQLFKSLARFITIDFDETLISTRWGERLDINQLGIYVLQLVQVLKTEQVIGMINEEQQDEDDLESIWVIEHHIAQSPHINATEHELGRLILNILNIPSNFNTEKAMETQKLEFKNYELQD